MKTILLATIFLSTTLAVPIKLQAHGDKSEPISFRNIWVRDL